MYSSILFHEPVLDFKTAPVGDELERDGYIVRNGLNEFADREEFIAKKLSGAWEFYVPYEGMSLKVINRNGVEYVFKNGEWQVKQETFLVNKPEVEVLDVQNNSFETTYIPDGEVGVVELGFLDSKGNFISFGFFENIESDSIFGKSILLKGDYSLYNNYPLKVKVRYSYSEKRVGEPVEFDTLIQQDETVDNVSLAGEGQLNFNVLNVDEDPVTQIHGANIILNQVAVAQILFTTSYLGKSLQYIKDGISYSGVFADSQIVVS